MRKFVVASDRLEFSESAIDCAILLTKQGNAHLVDLGTYRKGGVSRWFHSSIVDLLTKELKLHLFIAPTKS